ncbi:MAG: hypothetical protein ABEK12_01065, partial [Candidatus Nanohaloarchaea archaeon]
VDVMPENIGNRFNKALKDMFDRLVEIGIGTVTGTLIVVAKAIQVIVYLVALAIPFGILYLLGRRGRRWLRRHREQD